MNSLDPNTGEYIDPTKIELQTNVKRDRDPMIQRMSGHARHGMTPFDVPFISHIHGNLYQGGCDEMQLGLHLPHFFKHLISVYPWERYKVQRGQLETEVYYEMYDSVDQAFDDVDMLARIVLKSMDKGPTLIHCQAGLNRSSLIAARALMMEGRSADTAIKMLRESRSPAVLCNPAFEQHLRNLDWKPEKS